MESKIYITEFRNRLRDNTKIGSPKLKIPMGFLSVFTDNSKYFYGNFDNSSFELIINSNFMSYSYFLKGTYKVIEKKLIVNYNIEPVGTLRIAWIKYFPIIAFIMCNSIFYFERLPIEIFIIFNVLIVFISFFARLSIEWQNKKLKRKFNKIFEIIE